MLPGQSGLGSNGNEGVLCIPQGPSITGTSPSDCFVSYPGHSLGGGSYPSAEMQSVYSTAPADWARFHQDIKTIKERYHWQWDKRMMADYRWNIKRDLNNIEHDNQERKFYHSSNIHESFISAVSLWNDLMKIFVGLGTFSCIIFKGLVLIVMAKIVFLNK